MEHGKYSKQAIKTAFGSINKLMKMLGIPPNTTRMDSTDEVLNDFLIFYEKYHTTSSTKYRKHGRYSQSVVERIFGSWENMIKQLGLEYMGKTYGYDYMLNSLKKIYKKYGFISTAIINDECEFSYEALAFHFGNKDAISKILGVENAYCDTKSSKAKVMLFILINQFGQDDVYLEKTWNWLRNPKTNKCLKVDFYIQTINTAIEYDGKQHFVFTPYFHKTIENFNAQIERDKLKDSLLFEHKIRLVRISYRDKITQSFIAQKLCE